MEQSNNKIELNKTNVGVDAHIDPHNEKFAPQNVGADDSVRPHFEELAKTQGITLVTLVITIIIMLILAGVIIATTMDSDGIIADAEEATGQWNNRITAQDQAIQNVLAKRNEILGGTTTEPTTPPSTPVEGSITLNKSSLTLEIVDGVNTQETLTATKQNLTGTVNWTSSTPTVATVDSNGKITTVGAGTTTITASCGDKTATCTVTVTTKTTPKVTLSATTGEIEVDATLVLTASLNVTATQNIVWTSSDDTIATVVGSGTNNKTGTVTGKGAGTVTITAKYGDKTATCSVTVKEKPKYTVTFYDEDKTTVLDTVEVEEGGTAVYTGQTPTKASSGSTTYTFSYWKTGSGSKASLENITENLSVYAYYSATSTCFVAGTKVLTEEGLINIEDIKVGTKVYSMNETTGEIELKKVKNTIQNYVDKTMSKVYINGEILESTSNHRYYERNKGWKEANKLKVGDILLKADGTLINIEEIEIIESNGKLKKVYNIEVEDNHNYFVGVNSVLVHNIKLHPGGSG